MYDFITFLLDPGHERLGGNAMVNKSQNEELKAYQ